MKGEIKIPLSEMKEYHFKQRGILRVIGMLFFIG